MNCGTLTLPRATLLAAYLLVLFGIDEIGIANKPQVIFAITLAMAVSIAMWGTSCAPAAEER
jgi:hypothetical protein